MTVASETRRWESLWRTLVIRENTILPTLPRPTDATLNRFEQDTGFRLPQSYRAFAKVFGPGELAGDYHFFFPGYPGNEHSDLAAVNARIRVRAPGGPDFESFISSFCRDPEQVRRMVIFCGTGHGDWVGWDPEDVRDRRNCEYGIYQWHGEQPSKVADSFVQFVEEFCLATIGLGDEMLRIRQLFIPDSDLSGLV
jgi:hypothetical protein